VHGFHPAEQLVEEALDVFFGDRVFALDDVAQVGVHQFLGDVELVKVAAIYLEQIDYRDNLHPMSWLGYAIGVSHTLGWPWKWRRSFSSRRVRLATRRLLIWLIRLMAT